jgi:hypothetical protein
MLSTREKIKGDLTENTIMFCLLSFFLCCFCLHITEYEQIRGGAQNFLGPRSAKYLNTGLDIYISALLKYLRGL